MICGELNVISTNTYDPVDEGGVNFMLGVARKSLHVAAVQEIAMI